VVIPKQARVGRNRLPFATPLDKHIREANLHVVSLTVKLAEGMRAAADNSCFAEQPYLDTIDSHPLNAMNTGLEDLSKHLFPRAN
jgi:hypothetical protein